MLVKKKEAGTGGETCRMTVTEIRTDFDPDKWGPHAWKFLHMITFSYPEDPHPDIQEHFKQFFRSLGVALPCAKCREHYNEKFLRTVDDGPDDPFRNRESLTQWLVDIHNEVNAGNQKPRITSDHAKRLYTAKDLLCAGKASSNNKPAAAASSSTSLRPLFIVIVVFLLVIALAMGMVSYRRCFAQ